MHLLQLLQGWEQLDQYRAPETVSDDPEDFERCVARERGQEIVVAEQMGVPLLFGLSDRRRRTIGAMSRDLSPYTLWDSHRAPVKDLAGALVFVRGHCNGLQRGLEAVEGAGGIAITPWNLCERVTQWADWVKPEFLGRKVGVLTMESVLAGGGRSFRDAAGKIFLKTQEKEIHGVCRWDRPLDVIEYFCEILPEQTPFIVSEPMEILKDERGTREWRVWMVRGVPTSCSRYLDYDIDYETPREVAAFAESFGQAHSAVTPAAYVLDIAETPSGPKVIELNEAQASGRYGKNDFAAFLSSLTPKSSGTPIHQHPNRRPKNA